MPKTVEPAYEAHKAELKLRAMLDNLSGKHMHNLLHELLRTRKLIQGNRYITAPQEIADLLLKNATLASGTMPDSSQVTEAIDRYQHAKAPTLNDLEKRYNGIMERLNHPGKLSDVDANTVGDANTYLTLAAAITRHLKYDSATKFTDEEIREVARMYEHYVNVKIYNDPWHGTEKHPEKPPLYFLKKDHNESDLSYQQRRLIEADMLVQRIYVGELIRPHNDAPRRGRIKTEYWHDRTIFGMLPTLDMQESFEQVAEHMLAPHKTDSASAWAYIPKLSQALKLYHDAFADWQQSYEQDLQARLHTLNHRPGTAEDSRALASEESEFTATNALRRCLHDLKSELRKQGLSEDNTNKVAARFAIRIHTEHVSAKTRLKDAITEALSNKQGYPKLDESGLAEKIVSNSRFSEILAVVDAVTPYVNARQLHYPHLPYEPNDFTSKSRPATLVATELLTNYGVFDKGDAHRSRFTD